MNSKHSSQADLSGLSVMNTNRKEYAGKKETPKMFWRYSGLNMVLEK